MQASRISVERVRQARLVDGEWYLSQNPEVAALGMDPVEHFVRFGSRLGRSPSPLPNPEAFNRSLQQPEVQSFLVGTSQDRDIDPIKNGTAVIKRGYRKFDFDMEKRFLSVIDSEYQKEPQNFDSKKVSIIMPAFNREATIEDAIRSVVAQTHSNWELIIVDDGSTDGTRSVAEKYTIDNRIKYYKTDHLGVSSARNVGLSNATGEIISYLDSDNSWLENYLRTTVVFMVTAGVVSCYSAIETFGKEEKLYRGDIFSFQHCLDKNYIDLNSFSHRRSIRDSNGAILEFDQQLPRLVDWDFILRVARHATISYAPFVGVRYYDGAAIERITTSKSIEAKIAGILSRLKAKHNGLNAEIFDTGDGVALAAAPSRRPAAKLLRFFPDYTVNNAYQKLLYGGLEDWKIGPGSIEDCLREITEWRDPSRQLVFHLHWPHVIVSPAVDAAQAAERVDAFLSKVRLFKALGGRFLWTVHNVISHEPKYENEEIRLSREVAKLADWVHVHHPAVVDEAAPYFSIPSDRMIVAEHGNYIGALPMEVSRSQARSKLGIPSTATVFVFLGQIRPYKGIDELLNAFSKLSRSRPDAWLILAGKVLGVSVQELERRVQGIPNVVFRPQFIQDEEVQNFLVAADVAVLPYKKVLTSGSLFLAWSFGLPVICPRLGLLGHMVRDGVSGIVYEDETDALEQAMRRFLAFEESERQVLCRNAETAAEAVNWRETGGKLVRHLEGESFGHAVPFQATGERRQWFMAGEPRELEGRECVCIVLHYRGLDDTRRCLSSIRAQNANIGTVLISNNEKLDDIYTLRTEFPEVLSVQAAANDGFAAANNFGLWLARVAGAQFFWMVNPDVVVPDGYYSTLRSRVDQWPEHDFFGSTLVFGHRRETVAFCGGTVDIESGKPSHMHAGARTDELPAEPFECDYLTGANIFGRVRALPHMGYLPEEYFLYFEETDWMLRYARWNGGKTAIVFPDLIAVNAKNSERDGLPSRYYVYYFCRNAHSFARRYAANGRGSELAHIGEFSDAWLKKIKKLSPGRYAEFQELFERAVNDGQKGIDGKVNGI